MFRLNILDRLKGGYSDEWGYKLDSMSGHSERSGSKAGKALSLLS